MLLLVVVVGVGEGVVVDDVPVVVGGVGPIPGNSPGTSDCKLCIPC